MGYYSTIQETPKIELINEFRIELERLNNLGYDETPEFWHYWEDIFVDDNGQIDFEEYNFKAYEEVEFVKWLNQFKPSGTLRLQGEEGEYWGYEFQDGKIYELDFEIKQTRGKEI